MRAHTLSAAIRRSWLVLLLLASPAAPLSAAPPIPAEWLTPAEQARFESTPSYDETLAFLRRLEQRTPELRLAFFGTSAAGRPMPVVIVSREHAFDAAAARRLAKPIVLVQNGIHSGEIDGKDACLMLLRDFALGRRPELADAATLLIVPIYNVDGHERVSPWNRPNQEGPRAGLGARATSDCHDLNRDYLKASTPETRALLGLLNAWRPHLFVDVHVTDGCDHNWVLTWTAPEPPQLAAQPGAWMAKHLSAASGTLAAAGYPNGPYVDLADANDPTQGFESWIGEPRYANGYLALRNRPMVLIETQSHQPYERRVLATRDFLAALLAEVGRDGAALRAAVAAAEAHTVALGRPEAPASEIAIALAVAPATDRVRFPVYEWSTETSQVTGQPYTRYRHGVVREIEVPWAHQGRVVQSAVRPRGYVVLPGWPEIESRLAAHGLESVRLARPLELPVEVYRLGEPQPAPRSYQGLTRVRVESARRSETRTLPAGALWVPADQPDFEVAVQLFEPAAPDSLLQWGLLSTLFENKEWADPWIVEDEARRLLAADPQLAAEWQRALADPKLAGDRQARYFWWFRRMKWYDEANGLLPVFRVVEPQAAAKLRAALGD